MGPYTDDPLPGGPARPRIACNDGDHQPLADTCYTTVGLPANLRRPADYPIEASCMLCLRPIRCENFIAGLPGGEWVLKYPED